jgi:hypothetical protein
MFCKVQSVQSFTTRCSDEGMTTMTTLIEEQFRNSTEIYRILFTYHIIFPRYLLFYFIFDKIPIDKHIYNNNQSLNVQNINPVFKMANNRVRYDLC